MINENYKKDWGMEIPWCEEEDYASKLIIFDKAGNKTPFCFHKETKKSWFVNNGKFMIRWIDTKDGKVYQAELNEGQVHKIEPLVPVSLECISPGSITQASNRTDQNDMYVVIPATNIGR